MRRARLMARDGRFANDPLTGGDEVLVARERWIVASAGLAASVRHMAPGADGTVNRGAPVSAKRAGLPKLGPGLSAQHGAAGISSSVSRVIPRTGSLFYAWSHARR